MLIALLLFASQAIDRADALNAALTNCLFATARAAHLRAEPADQFPKTLARSCLGEEDAARTAGVSILVRRGLSRRAAEERIEHVLREGRSAVLRTYTYSSSQ